MNTVFFDEEPVINIIKTLWRWNNVPSILPLHLCCNIACELIVDCIYFFTMYLLCVSNQSFLHWRDLIWLRCCQPVPYELYFRLFFDLSDMVFQDNETFWKLYLFYGRILKYRNYNFSAILYVKTRWRLMCHVL